MSDALIVSACRTAIGTAFKGTLAQTSAFDLAHAVVDASEPTAFDVYQNGEHGGVLQAAITPLQQLNARAATMARQMAADAEAARAAAAQATLSAIAPSAQAAAPAPASRAPASGPVPYNSVAQAAD